MNKVLVIKHNLAFCDDDDDFGAENDIYFAHLCTGDTVV